jgi:hypothetical protein
MDGIFPYEFLRFGVIPVNFQHKCLRLGARGLQCVLWIAMVWAMDFNFPYEFIEPTWSIGSRSVLRIRRVWGHGWYIAL